MNVNDTASTELIESLPDTSKYKSKSTPIHKVKELLDKGLSHSQIAKLLNIDRSAVTRLIQRHGLNSEEDRLFKKGKADFLNSLQRRILNSITLAEIKKMATRDRIMTFGILYDKERLERGQATEIHDISPLVNKINELKAKLEDKISATEPQEIIDITPQKGDQSPLSNDNSVGNSSD